MCGIGGWIGEAASGEGAAAGLADSLRHRGPDSQGHRIWPDAGLVHTRLSIIDLSPMGAQPIANEDGSVWVVFNGEIYNHHALRDGLERQGHRFRGRSDSEVLPHLYEEHGAELVAMLRGMFALAIYDVRVRRLLLARDRFGIKPLFFGTTPGVLSFASEIGALRRFAGVDVTVDRQAAADFAALGYVPAPMTLFKGIRSLEPGQLLVSETDGKRTSVSTRRFQQFRMVGDGAITLEDAVERSRSLVASAVRSQLESDVPLGCLLSGGIDSSLVSAAAQRSLPGGLQTYNVQMPDPRYDETWAAVAVARHIGSRHQTLSLGESGGTWEEITSLLAHCGQPFADTSVFAVQAICREMRKEVTVALCGDGGDEGFAGYYFYWMVERIAGWLKWPEPVLRAGSYVAALASRFRMVSSSFAGNLRGYGAASDAEIVQSLAAWLDTRQHARLVRDQGHEPVERHFRQQWQNDLGPRPDRIETLSALAAEFNIRLGLPNDLLFKTDIASMRVGLEIRVPLLDEDLIDFALSLPRQFKVRGKEGKLVLRKLATEQLPAKVAAKPKHGFAVPVDTWVDDDFRRKLGSLLLGPRSVLPEFYEPAVYRPWLEAFVTRGQHPEVNRAGMYYRAIMLLAMQMSLAPDSVRT